MRQIKLPDTISEEVYNDIPIGGYGYRVVIERITRVGCTYRVKILTPNLDAILLPTKFRKISSAKTATIKKIASIRKAFAVYHAKAMHSPGTDYSG